jgi:hypothetical protein
MFGVQMHVPYFLAMSAWIYYLVVMRSTWWPKSLDIVSKYVKEGWGMSFFMGLYSIFTTYYYMPLKGSDVNTFA